jgi:L-lactate dehydrogenase complex protein LldG
MESRAAILERLRELRQVGDMRPRPIYTPESIFADIPSTDRTSLIGQFTQKVTALRGEVFTVASYDEAASKVAELARAADLCRCGRQSAPLLDRLFGSHQELGFLESEMTIAGEGEPLPHAAVESMQCAFTVADALVARTGSIVLRATTAGGRRLSVLPPIHCVIATADQLVPCLSSWLTESHHDRSWSYGTIITGPSRTADIERILVLGAHGPKRLIVIIIDAQ